MEVVYNMGKDFYFICLLVSIWFFLLQMELKNI